MTENGKNLTGFCVSLAGDRRSWTLKWIFSDETEDQDPQVFPATAEGAEELLDILRAFTAGRVKRRQ